MRKVARSNPVIQAADISPHHARRILRINLQQQPPFGCSTPKKGHSRILVATGVTRVASFPGLPMLLTRGTEIGNSRWMGAEYLQSRSKQSKEGERGQEKWKKDSYFKFRRTSTRAKAPVESTWNLNRKRTRRQLPPAEQNLLRYMHIL